MRPDDFDFLAKLLKERSGLVITPDKAYLLESRLMPLARTRNLKGIEDIVAKLRGRDEALARDVTEAMTTNESFFFRDQKPFDQFRDTILPQVMASRIAKKSIRIWSAACSSGQEAYSLAMLLKEQAHKLNGWHVEIVGTDISVEMLEKAKAGLYSQFEVQRGLPIQMLVKYFKKKEESWQIDAALRGMVQFREWNLLKDLRGLGQFDIVFCRNVLIYFDQPTKAVVLEGIGKQMPDDGFLYLGGAETVLGISDRFKPMTGQRGIYCLNRDGSATSSFPIKAPV
ncbi:protein-glutamate O-methyltransferase [Telmatospirillum sp.]|uniref:CheR family methyltransferase n=1 Tax=Telmatospirillum sp. TaxID=2079197 RepID=UPI002850FBBC|nr:protein-glutamate O-methyltransferase [Telmatospirillum sp.]MDR3440767.1 protein-glutamate O-methyltransferase [Telmatospirillum sp.]